MTEPVLRYRVGLVEIIALLEHIVASMNSRGALPKALFAYLELLRRLELARTCVVACTRVCDEEGERCHFGGCSPVWKSHAPPDRVVLMLTFLAFPLWCHRAYRPEAGLDSIRDVNLARVHRLLFSSTPCTSQESRRLSPPFRALDRRKQSIAVLLSNDSKRVALQLFRER